MDCRIILTGVLVLCVLCAQINFCVANDNKLAGSLSKLDTHLYDKMLLEPTNSAIPIYIYTRGEINMGISGVRVTGYSEQDGYNLITAYALTDSIYELCEQGNVNHICIAERPVNNLLISVHEITVVPSIPNPLVRTSDMHICDTPIYASVKIYFY